MQQTILEALFRLNNKATEQEKTSFLQNLQQPALELWRAFRAFPVTVGHL